jgi:virulence-associated protein VapD
MDLHLRCFKEEEEKKRGRQKVRYDIRRAMRELGEKWTYGIIGGIVSGKALHVCVHVN